MTIQAYRAPHAVQINGELHKAGTVFHADPSQVQVGDKWEKVTEAQAASIEASTNHVPDDADLEALPKTALQAVAYLRHVPGIAALDTDGLKTAIRASYEPKL